MAVEEPDNKHNRNERNTDKRDPVRAELWIVKARSGIAFPHDLQNIHIVYYQCLSKGIALFKPDQFSAVKSLGLTKTFVSPDFRWAVRKYYLKAIRQNFYLYGMGLCGLPIVKVRVPNVCISCHRSKTQIRNPDNRSSLHPLLRRLKSPGQYWKNPVVRTKRDSRTEICYCEPQPRATPTRGKWRVK